MELQLIDQLLSLVDQLQTLDFLSTSSIILVRFVDGSFSRGIQLYQIREVFMNAFTDCMQIARAKFPKESLNLFFMWCLFHKRTIFATNSLVLCSIKVFKARVFSLVQPL